MSERVFRVGQRVRVIHSDTDPGRVGEVCTVASCLLPLGRGQDSTLPPGTLIHELDYPGPYIAAAPPDWLEPFDDGREPAEWTESLRKLCKLTEDA